MVLGDFVIVEFRVVGIGKSITRRNQDLAFVGSFERISQLSGEIACAFAVTHGTIVVSENTVLDVVLAIVETNTGIGPEIFGGASTGWINLIDHTPVVEQEHIEGEGFVSVGFLIAIESLDGCKIEIFCDVSDADATVGCGLEFFVIRKTVTSSPP